MHRFNLRWFFRLYCTGCAMQHAQCASYAKSDKCLKKVTGLPFSVFCNVWSKKHVCLLSLTLKNMKCQIKNAAKQYLRDTW